MWPARRRRKAEDRGGVSVIDRPDGREEEAVATLEELDHEIATLSDTNRARRDRSVERRLVRLRHLAGIRMVDGAPEDPEHATADTERLPDSDSLPEIDAKALSPGLVRAG